MDSRPLEPGFAQPQLLQQDGSHFEFTKEKGPGLFLNNSLMAEPVGMIPPSQQMMLQSPSPAPPLAPAPNVAPRTASTRKDPSAAKAWNAMYERLLQYRAVHGTCLVPRNYQDDPRLGNWVSKQRANRRTLSADRAERLEAIGFIWCVTARETWDVMFERLVEYQKVHGDCLVPYHYHEEDPKLVTWVYKQRTQMKKGSLSEERVARLDSIGFVWFPQRNEWDAMLALLMDWKSKHGHCSVPLDYDQDKELSDWVFTQRRNRDKLSRERIKKLEAIGFEWHPVQRDMWEVMFDRLAKYKSENGNCLVPQRFAGDPKLGRWVTMQRENKNSLSPEKRGKLESIGFVFTVVTRAPWQVMFNQLVAYRQVHGDCLVPQRYKENPRLGGWVREQRKRKDNLPPERRQLLDSIGFAWRAKAVRRDPVTFDCNMWDPL